MSGALAALYAATVHGVHRSVISATHLDFGKYCFMSAQIEYGKTK